ncbi:hypothetical protein FOB72_17265 (plasmid) [Cupriavidus pauculus]|uniref:Uncharacterized protein n=1 Tax=Cupriavidus pauculus TaxID=82633 RepID=A0A5P2H6V5_9BURK|nr:hypothetical protein [Cupriavidus pauculus]QET03917.1 hypothetical protein FOB72_17265 [Cupriavidus pauculus]
MLGDLDELVLRCRNERARVHIGEAVTAYKAGAYRSAVIMTWVALAFDIVDKLKELSINGDAAATKTIEEYERIHKDGDISASLKFERSLLVVAKKDFELFSDSELIELERIQEDRNRCAHPSHNMEGEPFAPSAELARAHIRAAIDYVMKNEPAQGRHALDMVMKMLTGDYFPTNRRKAFEALAHSPLMTGRQSLVRAFLVVVLKDLLRGAVESRKRAKYINGLWFVKEKRPDLWQLLFNNEFSALSKSLDIKEHGERLLLILARLRDGWGALSPGIRAGLVLLVQSLPETSIVDVDEILPLPELRTAAVTRIKKLSAEDISHMLLVEDIPVEIVDHIVDSLCAAKSYASANGWVEALVSALWADYAALTQTHADRILDSVMNNRQLRDCGKLDQLLKFIANRRFGHGVRWNKVLVATERDPSNYTARDSEK